MVQLGKGEKRIQIQDLLSLILYTSTLCSSISSRSFRKRSVVFTVSISTARNVVVEKLFLEVCVDRQPNTMDARKDD